MSIEIVYTTLKVLESGLTRARHAIFDGKDGLVVDFVQTVAWSEAPFGDCISVTVGVATASMVTSFWCQVTCAWAKVYSKERLMSEYGRNGAKLWQK